MGQREIPVTKPINEFRLKSDKETLSKHFCILMMQNGHSYWKSSFRLHTLYSCTLSTSYTCHIYFNLLDKVLTFNIFVFWKWCCENFQINRPTNKTWIIWNPNKTKGFACNKTKPRKTSFDLKTFWELLYAASACFYITMFLTSGPPDVEQACEPSLQAWSPELSLYDANVTSPCPETEGCILTLRFLHPVIPHRLTLWVTYTSTSKC